MIVITKYQKVRNRCLWWQPERDAWEEGPTVFSWFWKPDIDEHTNFEIDDDIENIDTYFYIIYVPLQASIFGKTCLSVLIYMMITTIKLYDDIHQQFLL